MSLRYIHLFNHAVTAEEKEIKRIRCIVIRAETKRTTTILKICSIHNMALRTADEPSLIDELQVAIVTLDDLKSRFEAADDDVLDSLLQLNGEKDYSPDLPAEVLAIVNATKAIDTRYNSSSRDSLSSHASFKLGIVNDASFQRSSRLPEIPFHRSMAIFITG